MICIGCGSDISNAKGKRSLSTEASQHVKPLWCRIFDEELERRGIQAQASSFVTTATEITGRMCRQCFTCFDRCKKLIDSLKNGVGKAIEAFQRHDSHLFRVHQTSHAIGVAMEVRSSLHPPPPKRVAVDSRSPDVVVRNKLI